MTPEDIQCLRDGSDLFDPGKLADEFERLQAENAALIAQIKQVLAILQGRDDP